MVKKNLDWQSIEEKYRAGSPSIRQIAKEHGCSETAIRKHMVKEGIERDLTERVREKVRNGVVRKRASAYHNANLKSDKDIVNAAALAAQEVVLSHIKILKRLNGKTKDYLKVLDMLDKLEGDESIPIGQRVRVLRDLSTIATQVITYERKVHNLDDNARATLAGSLIDILNEVAAAGRTVQVDGG